MNTANRESVNHPGSLFWTAMVFDHLRPVRVPMLVVAIGAAATLAVDQIAELFLITTLSADARGRYLWLVFGSAAAGLAVWYQSRNAYRLRYPRWPVLEHSRGIGLRIWLPRLAGAGVPFLAALGCVLAYARIDFELDEFWSVTRFVSRVAGLVLVAIVLLLFFVYRRTTLARVQRQLGRSTIDATPQLERRVDRIADLGTVPRWIFVAAVVLNVVCTVLIALRPEWLLGLGPLAIVLLAGGFLSLVGGYVTMVCDRRGLPVLSLLALLALTWHWAYLNDNHLVRLHPDMNTRSVSSTPLAPPRIRFEDYHRAWIADRCDDRQTCPMVLVSAEGGGIRAAAWAEVVLSDLNARSNGALLRHTFAVSGVSGGSLGLAVVYSLHRDLGMPAWGGGHDTPASAFVARDFLAPALANMLFVDFTQRLLPGAWFDDRGRALTRAWESAYADIAGDSLPNRFAQAWHTSYLDEAGTVDPALPAMFLNSTVVATGQRFVQHPFERLPDRNGGWFAAVDGGDYGTTGMPLSEVVLNSARFTYVSPAGTLRVPDRQPLQLVDGGYFENSGATTLVDVIRQLRGGPDAERLQLFVLHISNDPGVGPFASQRPGESGTEDICSGDPAEDRLHGDVMAPLAALLSTRQARGAHARSELAASLADRDRLWHFRLCRGRYLVPLGWAISEAVFGELREQLGARYDTRRLADDLVIALDGR